MPFPLVKADGLALPLPDGCLDAAYLCHVLHLVPRWQDAVAELVRTLRPGGLLLIDMGGAPTSVGRELSSVFNRFAALDRPRPGCTNPADLNRVMAAHGAKARIPEPITFTLGFTIASVLERLGGNQFSTTWSLSDDARADALAQTTAWAAERFGDLDARHEERIAVQWRGYDLP
jgi:SAM-dependent methyltransferase